MTMPPHATAPSPLGSLAEQGVALIRRRARALLAVSVIFGLPGTLLSVASVLPLAATLQRLVPDGTAETLPPLDERAVREIGLGLLIVVAGSIGSGILGSLTALAVTRIVADDRQGAPVSARAAARGAIGRALPAIGLSVVTTIAIGGIWLAGGMLAYLLATAGGAPTSGGPLVFAALAILVALVAATVVAGIRWSMAGPAIALTADGPIAALRRSWRLTAGHGLRILAVLAGTAVVTGVLGSLASEIGGLVITDLIATPLGLADAADLLVATLVGLALAPVGPAYLALLWGDLHARADRTTA